MTTPWLVATAVALLYAVFLVWWGGRGKPLSAAEIDTKLQALAARAQDSGGEATVDDLRQLCAQDDGREFVMHNLVRYRPKALYPPGLPYTDDPRAADRRYARLILWPLLRRASLVLFVGRRSGSFVELAGAPAWHYIASVRYRSLRDFLDFALEIEGRDIVVHKWAAIETTHIFPVQPVISLSFVRLSVAVVLSALGWLVCQWVR